MFGPPRPKSSRRRDAWTPYGSSQVMPLYSPNTEIAFRSAKERTEIETRELLAKARDPKTFSKPVWKHSSPCPPPWPAKPPEVVEPYLLHLDKEAEDALKIAKSEELTEEEKLKALAKAKAAERRKAREKAAAEKASQEALEHAKLKRRPAKVYGFSTRSEARPPLFDKTYSPTDLREKKGKRGSKGKGRERKRRAVSQQHKQHTNEPAEVLTRPPVSKRLMQLATAVRTVADMKKMEAEEEAEVVRLRKTTFTFNTLNIGLGEEEEDDPGCGVANHKGGGATGRLTSMKFKALLQQTREERKRRQQREAEDMVLVTDVTGSQHGQTCHAPGWFAKGSDAKAENAQAVAVREVLRDLGRLVKGHVEAELFCDHLYVAASPAAAPTGETPAAAAAVTAAGGAAGAMAGSAGALDRSITRSRHGDLNTAWERRVRICPPREGWGPAIHGPYDGQHDYEEEEKATAAGATVHDAKHGGGCGGDDDGEEEEEDEGTIIRELKNRIGKLEVGDRPPFPYFHEWRRGKQQQVPQIRVQHEAEKKNRVAAAATAWAARVSPSSRRGAAAAAHQVAPLAAAVSSPPPHHHHRDHHHGYSAAALSFGSSLAADRRAYMRCRRLYNNSCELVTFEEVTLVREAHALLRLFTFGGELSEATLPKAALDFLLNKPAFTTSWGKKVLFCPTSRLVGGVVVSLGAPGGKTRRPPKASLSVVGFSGKRIPPLVALERIALKNKEKLKEKRAAVERAKRHRRGNRGVDRNEESAREEAATGGGGGGAQESDEEEEEEEEEEDGSAFDPGEDLGLGPGVESPFRKVMVPVKTKKKKKTREGEGEESLTSERTTSDGSADTSSNTGDEDEDDSLEEEEDEEEEEEEEEDGSDDNDDDGEGGEKEEEEKEEEERVERWILDLGGSDHGLSTEDLGASLGLIFPAAIHSVCAKLKVRLADTFAKREALGEKVVAAAVAAREKRDPELRESIRAERERREEESRIKELEAKLADEEGSAEKRAPWCRALWEALYDGDLDKVKFCFEAMKELGAPGCAPTDKMFHCEALWVLNRHSRGTMIDRFKEVDTNGNGELDLEEVLQGARVLDLTPEVAEGWFRCIDADDSGTVSLDEFLGMYEKSQGLKVVRLEPAGRSNLLSPEGTTQEHAKGDFCLAVMGHLGRLRHHGCASALDAFLCMKQLRAKTNLMGLTSGAAADSASSSSSSGALEAWLRHHCGPATDFTATMCPQPDPAAPSREVPHQPPPSSSPAPAVAAAEAGANLEDRSRVVPSSSSSSSPVAAVLLQQGHERTLPHPVHWKGLRLAAKGAWSPVVGFSQLELEVPGWNHDPEEEDGDDDDDGGGEEGGRGEKRGAAKDVGELRRGQVHSTEEMDDHEDAEKKKKSKGPERVKWDKLRQMQRENVLEQRRIMIAQEEQEQRGRGEPSSRSPYLSSSSSHTVNNSTSATTLHHSSGLKADSNARGGSADADAPQEKRRVSFRSGGVARGDEAGGGKHRLRGIDKEAGEEENKSVQAPSSRVSTADKGTWWKLRQANRLAAAAADTGFAPKKATGYVRQRPGNLM